MKYFVHSTAIIDEGAVIGEGSKVWHFSHVMSGSTIGDFCNIGQNVVISPGVTLGSHCKVQNNVSVYTGVECEEGVFLGPSCVFTNVINPRALIEKKSEYRKTLLKKGASIGANATILCGHTIGRFALIGAGSVVTRDVEDYEIVIGNPARHYAYACECGETMEQISEHEYKCPVCHKQYEKYEKMKEV